MRDAAAIGARELRAVRAESRYLYWSVAAFSFAVNLLMLTGPFYMLNVYDRVLGSRSVETLIALTVLVVFLYAMMGLLDLIRGRVMSRIAARFQARLDRRVFSAALRASSGGGAESSATAQRDLETVQRLLSSPALMSAFDLPFAPLFFFGIFLFHPALGILGLVGAAILVALAIGNQLMSKGALEQASRSSFASEQLGSQIRIGSDMVQALGMRGAAFSRWQQARGASLDSTIAATDTTGSFTSIIKAFRLLLQSGMLGLGALLVLEGQMTAGAMIAGSILLGRALAPIEQIVGQWALFQRAREGWGRLARLLGEQPPEEARTALPRPAARLSVEQLTIVPPGQQQASLRLVSFLLSPGEAMGVIGPSGAGKTTLARALTGLWRPAGGKVRLDGAALDQYEPDVLGSYIGYLPQQVALFDGTIRDNIARMASEPDDEEVVRAAQAADAHDMILKLPDGYDTRVTAAGGRLSGGQVQRVGLARALYGKPVLLVLDEPNSNLDNDGSKALNQAIRSFKAEGNCVIIMAHRPSAIQECDLLLMLEQGARRAFGPKDEVLREMVRNHEQIAGGSAAGGVT
ncbi:type I secretion system permease/ATPase [Pseudoroseicyclus aestuarii]|uniref:PrtD family type I secretion system ABC transporter n=1 Tax=Pseudoroseicyclus aestuarii TaxID=1795041 RepID=A0A318SPW8_9RHOB|nr:type I secretion system permease/ATPase [Pseudoroseicyclus aestuarii]PYE83712.1 PrtD family type I secretion system ABC transporter [Pseudoroseicyclus aestuarii]